MSSWKTVLSFVAIAALPAIAGANVSGVPTDDDYVARYCYTPDEDVAAVTFANKSGHQRRMSFSAKAQFSAVYLGYFTDIAIVSSQFT